MANVVWEPSALQISRANVTRLMERMGFAVHPLDVTATTEAARGFVRHTQTHIEAFWDAAVADMGVRFSTPYTQVLDCARGPAFADWFVDGQINIVDNAIDRHLGGALAGKVALIAETEDGQHRRYTYAELDREVCRLAAALAALGVGVGDRVASYMPMGAEVVFGMLAVQKLGAIFVPIFSGYAPAAVHQRLADGGVKVVLTADGGLRRGVPVPLKAPLDAALQELPELRHVLVMGRLQAAGAGAVACPMTPGRDHDWATFVTHDHPPVRTLAMPAMAPALMLFTSGTTGKPKGTVHSHAGCLVQMAKEVRYNFDLKSEDIFWWFTDIGWMMGPWSVIGVLSQAGTVLITEGAPDFPAPDRLWDTIERHGVTTFGLSPTAVRLLMRAGDDWVRRHPMPSLRILGSTGEPWDDASYRWYFERVGQGRCPVINISGGTDIVGCFLAPLPILPLAPASLQCPGLGMDVDVFDEHGQSLVGEVGYLVCKQPAPSMTRGLWNAEEQYLETYWSRFPGVWNHGDWARVDADGHWYILGRADDTMKIAGRRVGPGEIEAALIAHPAVSEAAAVGVPDPLKGTDVVCFVVLHPGAADSAALRTDLRDTVVTALGKVDRPRAVHVVDDLPKTRSAKILRRLIRRRYLGESDLGDLSSVANPEALDGLPGVDSEA